MSQILILILYNKYNTLVIEHCFSSYLFSSSFPGLVRSGSRQQSSADVPLHSNTMQLLQGAPEPFPGQMSFIALQRVLGLPRGLLPVGHSQKIYKRNKPRRILISCPNHLNCLLSTQRSSSSTPSSLRMSGLLTLSLLAVTCSIPNISLELFHHHPQFL